jgi:hypothetical protein
MTKTNKNKQRKQDKKSQNLDKDNTKHDKNLTGQT